MASPLELLPTVQCHDCSWTRRALPETARILILAAREHLTVTDGHHVEWSAS